MVVHNDHTWEEVVVRNDHTWEEEVVVHNAHILEPLHIVLCYIGTMECPRTHGIHHACTEAFYEDEEDDREEGQGRQSTCHGHGDHRQESQYSVVVEEGEVEEVQQAEGLHHHTHTHSPQYRSHRSLHPQHRRSH